MNKKTRKLSKLLWLSMFSIALFLVSWLSAKDAEAACSHRYTGTRVTSATCTKNGKTEIICATCKKVLKTTYSAKVAHSWNISAATCTTDKKCKVCGTVGQNKTGHNYEWKILYDSTCKSVGSKEERCRKCGDLRNVATIAKKAHSWNINEATCTTDKKCKVCGTVGQNKTGHNYEWKILYDSTCTSVGSKEERCRKCGDLRNVASIAKAPHHVVTIETPPTCYSSGSIVKKCDRSGCTYYEGATVIPPYAHTLVKNTSKSVEPTCTKTGKLVQYCKSSGCTYTKTTELSKLKHNYTAEIKVTAPTCTENGYTRGKCKCGAWGDKYNITNATGHVEDTSVWPSASAVDSGHGLFCKVCKKWYSVNHNMVTYTVTDTKGGLTGQHIKICVDSRGHRCGHKEYVQSCRHTLQNQTYYKVYIPSGNTFIKQYVMKAECKVCKNAVTGCMQLAPITQGTLDSIHDAGFKNFISNTITKIPYVKEAYRFYGNLLKVEELARLCREYEALSNDESYRWVNCSNAGIEFTELEKEIKENFAIYLDYSEIIWEFQSAPSATLLVNTDM